MKKITSVVCVLLALTLVVVSLPTVMAEGVKREFLIDGQLDPWYLNFETTKEGDVNNYYIQYLDPYVVKGLMFDNYFGELETDAQLYTAYDDAYVYFYIKVWDDDIVKEGTVSDTDIFDEITLRFDPDPDSKSNAWYKEVAYQDPDQGDSFIKMHLNQAGEFVVTTYEKEGFTKVGFNGVLLKDYFANPENVCGFVFDEDKSSQVDASSGYGIEVRFPRYDDSCQAYRFSATCKNSGEKDIVLATGAPAFGLGYCFAVYYSSVNPFFTQTFSWGDVNEDKAIDAKDALMVLKASVDKMDLNQKQAVLAEVDGKDGINAKDALEILKYSVKKITKFPIEEIVITPTDVTPTNQ